MAETRCPHCRCPVIEAAGGARAVILLEPQPGGRGQLGLYDTEGNQLPLADVLAGKGHHRHTCTPGGCPEHNQPGLF